MKIIFTGLLAAVLVLLIAGTAIANDAMLGYVSHPNEIPRMGNFQSKNIEPGQSGDLTFTIQNRYHSDITNVVLTCEIYSHATIDGYTELPSGAVNPPSFDSGQLQTSKSLAVIYGWNATRNTAEFNKLVGEEPTIQYKIRTSTDDTQGIYYLRFSLEFDYNGTHYKMESRGHFSKTEWDQATSNPMPGDVGNINITMLEVAGILPDTSISVRAHIPAWPLYLLITIMVLLGLLALVFFAIDEYGMFPELEKRFQYVGGKLNQFTRISKRKVRTQQRKPSGEKTWDDMKWKKY